MKVFEFRLKVYMLKKVKKEGMLEQISKLVDSCLVKGGLQELHEKNAMKFYSFNGFYPVERSGVYDEGKVYTVTLRTVSEKVGQVFKSGLAMQQSGCLKALTLSERVVVQKPVEKIFALTPILVKFDEEGYWRGTHRVEEFEERLKVGLIKKYNKLFETKIEEDFEWYTSLKIDNQKPIANQYKGIQLLGDKVTLGVASNEVAQKLAWIAIGTGIGEMNARGFGFMNYRYM